MPRPDRFLFSLCCLWALVLPLAASESAPPRATLEFDGDLSESTWSVAALSPLWTADDHIYAARVDRRQRLIVTQKRPGGEVAEHVVYEGVRHDNHNAPSIAVDARGHIHVVGDLHNGNPDYQWSYWVSDQPHDISAFSFRGGSVWNEPTTWLPSNMPSYALFRPDNNDRLYVTWRGRILSQTNVADYRAVMLATLPEGPPGPWQMLGQYHPQRQHWPGRGIAWESHARPARVGATNPSVYQTLRGHTWFDAENRLHMTWVIFGPGARTPADPGHKSTVGSGATHLLYSRSDDGGHTWVDAGGQALALPIQHDSRGLVLARDPGDLTTQVYLTTTADGRPIIAYSQGGYSQHGEHFMVIADTSGRWSAPRRLPTSARETYRLFADRSGNLTLPGQDQWYRSTDDGETWVAFTGLPAWNGGGSATFDYRHLRETGEIRFVRRVGEREARRAEVWTVQFP